MTLQKYFVQHQAILPRDNCLDIDDGRSNKGEMRHSCLFPTVVMAAPSHLHGWARKRHCFICMVLILRMNEKMRRRRKASNNNGRSSNNSIWRFKRK
eukprot:scaffold6852_cov201-Skeletonema_marinoi.AAC.3